MVLKIYLCAFINNKYIEEAKVCIQSIRQNGLFNGEIYLFTDMNVVVNDENVHIIKVNCKTVELSAVYRTRLFEHLDINKFSEDDIILYLDSDIVVMKPIPSFEFITDKIHVYGYPSRKQKEGSFAGFITSEPKYVNYVAFCSGILLFRPSNKIKQVFDEIYSLYLELINKNKINPCWEQPALCYKLIEHEIVCIDLNDLVYEERTKGVIEDGHVFNHLCGMRSCDRVNLMKKYL
jgi:lipopolysaccharide biosynthesis glycosyltransferase